MLYSLHITYLYTLKTFFYTLSTKQIVDISYSRRTAYSQLKIYRCRQFRTLIIVYNQQIMFLIFNLFSTLIEYIGMELTSTSAN